MSDDVIAEARAHWQRVTEYLVALATAVDSARWDEPSANAGWTNKELLAHLATGYVTRFARYRCILDGIEPRRPDELAANQENVGRWRDAMPEAIVEEMLRQRSAFAALLERLGPEHLALSVPLSESPRLVRDDLPQIDRHALEHAADLAPAAVAAPPAPS